MHHQDSPWEDPLRLLKEHATRPAVAQFLAADLDRYYQLHIASFGLDSMRWLEAHLDPVGDVKGDSARPAMDRLLF